MTHILVVEDDPDVGMLLDHALTSAGHQVSRVASVSAAMLLLKYDSYDLLLSDLNLPGGSGLSVADDARARGTKTLLVTGNAFPVPADEHARHEYVKKPIRPGELLAVIERVLAN